MAYFINNRQNGTIAKKVASVTYDIGDFLTTNGAGEVKKVDAITDVILGICNEKISATDADYATQRDITFSEPLANDEIVCTVTGGGATQALEQTTVRVDIANPGNVITTAGTQFYVTRVINANTVVGKIALTI